MKVRARQICLFLLASFCCDLSVKSVRGKMVRNRWENGMHCHLPLSKKRPIEGRVYKNDEGTDPSDPASVLGGTNSTNIFMWTKYYSQQQNTGSNLTPISRGIAELLKVRAQGATSQNCKTNKQKTIRKFFILS